VPQTLPATEAAAPAPLRALRLGIDTHRHQPVLYLPASSAACRSEGFRARSRVLVSAHGGSVEAVLHIADEHLVPVDCAGFSEAAWHHLDLHDGDLVSVHHASPIRSLEAVRRKLAGEVLDRAAYTEIMADVVAGRYADEHIAAFVAACSRNMDAEEVALLTHAMVDAGETLAWPAPRVVDKHCVGGLPGNRTTPIVVAIGVAAGLCMPKTSSRAITSPAGTADTMAVITRVDLGYEEMRQVVQATGGCLAWGGSVDLSPADDILIRIERSLEIDAPAQLVASVLSKKKAAGSTHCLIDIPVGPTAKIRSAAEAASVASLLTDVAARIGITLDIVETDGTQPVGNGIGPALEARDVLAVLRGAIGAPKDLRDRGLFLASRVLELGGAAPRGEGAREAERLLASGEAWDAFAAICKAQGGLWKPLSAGYVEVVEARADGRVQVIDNRGLGRLAKLAGAPDDASAGIDLHVRTGREVQRGDPLFSVHADHEGSLRYALEYLSDAGSPVPVR
jgi:thymidine phosphorylase